MKIVNYLDNHAQIKRYTVDAGYNNHLLENGSHNYCIIYTGYKNISVIRRYFPTPKGTKAVLRALFVRTRRFRLAYSAADKPTNCCPNQKYPCVKIFSFLALLFFSINCRRLNWDTVFQSVN